MKRTNLYLRLLVAIVMTVIGEGVWAGTVKDVLTLSATGVPAKNVYEDFENKSLKSNAVYAGNCGGWSSTIQLRASNNSGIITTETGGKVKKVTVKWNAATTAGYSLEIYGKSSAYTTAADLYNEKKSGISVGTIKKGTSTTYTFSENANYSFIGLRTKDKSGTLYIDKIEIEWEDDSYAKKSTTIAFPKASYNATIGEAFDAPVATVSAGGSTVEGAVLAYTGDNDAVATVDAETGAVTLVGAGTVNITATYAGDETYDASSGSYVLTVASAEEPIIVPGEEQTVTWVVKDSEYEENQKLNGEKILKDKISILLTKEESYNPYYDKSRQSVHFYDGNALTIAAAEGYAVTKIVMNYNSSITFGANVGTVSEIVAKSSTWTGFSPFVILKNKGGAYGELASVAVYYVELADTEETVIVGAAGYGTFCPNKAVILGDGTVSSIIVGVTDGVLEQETIGVIPAGTGVLLTGEGTYKLYTYAGLSAVAPATNYLTGVLSSTTAPEGSYVLQNHDGVVAFYHVGETRPTVGANKAYLQLPAEAAKLRTIFFTAEEANAVGISLPQIAEDDEIEAVYTLNGVRVGALQRGLNIVKMKSGRTEKRFVP
ncbi:MAG: hypothetical protein IJ635_08685 [Bacteroidaceae bacterium]|nr:hypothetical protein [Bacteroidaceae bacterium]